MLEPCHHCKRHIRDREVSCPFCGEARSAAPSRVQLVAATVLVGAALTLSACPRVTRTKYGAPPAPSSQATTTPTSQPSPEPDPVAPAALYGAPMPPIP
jgi:hypothetical protein